MSHSIDVAASILTFAPYMTIFKSPLLLEGIAGVLDHTLKLDSSEDASAE